MITQSMDKVSEEDLFLEVANLGSGKSFGELALIKN